MNDESTSVAPVIRPGYFHRLAIACGAGQQMDSWLRNVLGARPLTSRIRQVHGLPMHQPGAGASDESGAVSEMLWLGGIPVALLTATDGDGPLGRYVARYGTGLHSVAWTVEDLWAAETLLRRRGVRITGVDVPGRHFFMHPADTSGLLVEWSDTDFADDPRDGGALPEVPAPLVDVRSVAWLTVTVRDARAAAELLASLMEATAVRGNPVGDPEHEDTVDLRIGDVVVRLVSPRSTRSRYAAAVEQHGERLHAMCLRVDDLDGTLATLEREGLHVTAREGCRAWTDPAATLGMPLEWTGRRGRG
ncbi:VOC family protein [Peterkaempfera bronchialis]|uniref:VOC domain-containing protein n=1 Tax=Peterkaempfera bronchialis TaxID=2126346 RepID=A0A345SRE4_9ACTN|nr:VOC family protein [Peterkaempfera bronchialis]AXI76299.1 hypothetical protein C7M71_001195 [Peterkaempfera bronchialis]